MGVVALADELPSCLGTAAFRIINLYSIGPRCVNLASSKRTAGILAAM